MSTIDYEPIIRTILANKGVYPGDPPYRFVFTYTNFNGIKTYAVDNVRERYLESRYVRNPILLLQDGELTDTGKEELAALNAKLGRPLSEMSAQDEGFDCRKCGAFIQKGPPGSDVDCDKCGQTHNCFGQQIAFPQGQGEDYAGERYDDDY